MFFFLPFVLLKQGIFFLYFCVFEPKHVFLCILFEACFFSLLCVSIKPCFCPFWHQGTFACQCLYRIFNVHRAVHFLVYFGTFRFICQRSFLAGVFSRSSELWENAFRRSKTRFFLVPSEAGTVRAVGIPRNEIKTRAGGLRTQTRSDVKT